MAKRSMATGDSALGGVAKPDLLRTRGAYLGSKSGRFAGAFEFRKPHSGGLIRRASTADRLQCGLVHWLDAEESLLSKWHRLRDRYFAPPALREAAPERTGLRQAGTDVHHPDSTDQATRSSSTGTSSRHDAGAVIVRTPRRRRSDGAVSERWSSRKSCQGGASARVGRSRTSAAGYRATSPRWLPRSASRSRHCGQSKRLLPLECR